MSVSAISSGSSYATTELTSAVSSSDSLVTQDAFLQLLVTQLKYQDPLEPQDSSEFVAELAQFSSLEQMTSISSSLETVLELSITDMIGKTVTVLDSNSELVTGTVEGIVYYADGPAVTIDGTDYAFSQVQNVGATDSE